VLRSLTCDHCAPLQRQSGEPLRDHFDQSGHAIAWCCARELKCRPVVVCITLRDASCCAASPIGVIFFRRPLAWHVTPVPCAAFVSVRYVAVRLEAVAGLQGREAQVPRRTDDPALSPHCHPRPTKSRCIDGQGDQSLVTPTATSPRPCWDVPRWALKVRLLLLPKFGHGRLANAEITVHAGRMLVPRPRTVQAVRGRRSDHPARVRSSIGYRGSAFRPIAGTVAGVPWGRSSTQRES
jgi:hypothetical protein